MFVRPRAVLVVLAVAILVYLLSSKQRKQQMHTNARWVARGLAAGLVVYWVVILVEWWRRP